MKSEVSFWSGVHILIAVALLVGGATWYYLIKSPAEAGLVTPQTAMQAKNAPFGIAQTATAESGKPGCPAQPIGPESNPLN